MFLFNKPCSLETKTLDAVNVFHPLKSLTLEFTDRYRNNVYFQLLNCLIKYGYH